MIDQFQLRALGEKLRLDTAGVARNINAQGREHLEYLQGLATMLQEFLAVVDEQRQRFAIYAEHPPVEQLNLNHRRQPPRIAAEPRTQTGA
jgi:hypothetical protein